jgi:hypothetical protein
MTNEETHEHLAPRHQLPGEPHFDDALSISQARPVVPLKQLEEKVQRKRKWILCGTFLLTMLLGTVSGLISAYFKLREVSQASVTQSGLPTVKMSEESFSSTVSHELDTKDGFGNVLVGLTPVEERPLKLLTPKRAVIALKRETINIKPSLPVAAVSEEEELRRIRESLLTEDSKKQRVRSVGRREQRRS